MMATTASSARPTRKPTSPPIAVSFATASTKRPGPTGRAANWFGRKRVSLFSRDLYRHGLFGHFIGFGHFVAKLYGVDPKEMIRARTLDEQRAFFDTSLAPLFEKRFVRWATSQKPSLYGLGIPPGPVRS